VSEEQAAPWLLSQRDLDRIFDDVIAPRLMDGVSRPDEPRLQFVLGQAGAGKTTAQRTAMERMGSHGAVIADVDSLLVHHPAYAELLAADDQTASGLIGKDTVAWLLKSIDLAEQNRVNLIREGGPAPGVDAARFAEQGYSTGMDVMAVSAAVSRLSVLSRYQSMREQVGFGRTVPVEVHNRTYESLPKLLTANHHRMWLSEVSLHRRDGSPPFYQNNLTAAGQWRIDAPAGDALRIERDQPLNPQEAAWFVRRFAELNQTLPQELRAQLPEIADLARPLGVDVQAGLEGKAVGSAAGADRDFIARFTQGPTLTPGKPTVAPQAVANTNRTVANRPERLLD
jgi:hypothetical protein